jgi:hypothetical protein
LLSIYIGSRPAAPRWTLGRLVSSRYSDSGGHRLRGTDPARARAEDAAGELPRDGGRVSRRGLIRPGVMVGLPEPLKP